MSVWQKTPRLTRILASARSTAPPGRSLPAARFPAITDLERRHGGIVLRLDAPALGVACDERAVRLRGLVRSAARRSRLGAGGHLRLDRARRHGACE